MHDPMTVAFTIGRPWRDPVDPATARIWPTGYRPPWITIWHVDPQRDGSDDSCDWSGRHRPLNGRERDLLRAVDDLIRTLGHRPYWPDPRLHGEPGAVSGDGRDRGAIGAVSDALWAWRQRGWRLHPRWHVWHWRVQIHPLQAFKRWAFSRCATCGGRFAAGDGVVTAQWGGHGPRWFRSEERVHHVACLEAAGHRGRPQREAAHA